MFVVDSNDQCTLEALSENQSVYSIVSWSRFLNYLREKVSTRNAL